MFWSLWQHLCWLCWQHKKPQHECVAAWSSEEQTSLVLSWQGPGQQPEHDAEVYLHCRVTSEAEGKAWVKLLIFYFLCSLKSRGKKDIVWCCLEQSKWSFFSIHIRMCNIGRDRDEDIPVRHLHRSGEEMAIAQMFWQLVIWGIHLNCDLGSRLPCVTKPFTGSLEWFNISFHTC